MMMSLHLHLPFVCSLLTSVCFLMQQAIMATVMFAWASLDDPEEFLGKLIAHDVVTASSLAFSFLHF